MWEKKELWKNKRMYEQFVREMPETIDEKETKNSLRKVETKAVMCATQEEAIRIN